MYGRITRAAVLRRAAVGAGAVALAACGGPSSATEAPASSSKGPVTINIDNDWSQGDRLTLVKAWLELAAQKFPNVKADLRPTADSQEKTIALFASDQQGDLVQLDQHIVPVFGPKGSLQEITPTLNALKFDVNKVYDVQNITHWNGKRHGLLIQLNANTVLYNRTAFLQSGVKEPTAAWTWDDYVDAARRLSQPEKDFWGSNLSPDPYYFFWAANVPYLDAKSSPPKSLWDTPAAKDVLRWMADLTLKHRAAPSRREQTEKRLNFNLGHFGINVQGVPNPGVVKTIDGKFEFDAVPLPKHPKTGRSVPLITGHNYLATAKAKQRGVLTEAVQVLTALYDKEIQDLYLSGLAVSSLPPLKEAAARAGSLPGMPKNYKVALDSIPIGQNYDKVIGFQDWHSATWGEWNKVLNSEISVDQAAVNMARLGDAALSQAAR